MALIVGFSQRYPLPYCQTVWMRHSPDSDLAKDGTGSPTLKIWHSKLELIKNHEALLDWDCPSEVHLT